MAYKQSSSSFPVEHSKSIAFGNRQSKSKILCLVSLKTQTKEKVEMLLHLKMFEQIWKALLLAGCIMSDYNGHSPLGIETLPILVQVRVQCIVLR